MNGPRPADRVSSLFSAASAFEWWGDGDEQVLYPEEREVVADAVVRRRRQFAAGRACARRAVAEVGATVGPILVGPRRAPRWPTGVTGSISHTEGYAVAVAAPMPSTGPWSDGHRATLGIDAEQIGRVTERLHRSIFVADERDYLAGLGPAERAQAATVMFGAKEAFYKAQFAVTGAWVGFHDVALVAHDDRYELHRATDLEALDHVRWPVIARWSIEGGIAVTGVEAWSRPR